MKAIDGRNNVKIYNLSAGKALPEWLSDRRRRQLNKKDAGIRNRIELIQDFTMPDISNCIKVSRDGRYIVATGTYKPRVKCFEVAAMSLKFERCFDADVIKFDILSDDYSKLVFLQEERYVEFHNQGGRWFRTRIPKFGRDMAYHYPSCDLYIGASGNDVYRLNLDQGRFLNSLQTSGSGVNACTFNPIHYLLTCGTEMGTVEAWDPRSRQRVGVLDCALHMAAQDINYGIFTSAKSLGVTSVAYNDALTLAVGTQTGQVIVYDIRSDKPLLVKDHMDGFAIKKLFFHESSKKVFSMSRKMVKIWDKEKGDPYTSVESHVDFNDMSVVSDTGMMFLATEDAKMQTYFIPSLGPAPRWCSHLDAMIEELEEEEAPATYDDYKFVTEEELNQLGLKDLIGTNMLRAVMHGYYMDVRLYNKAKLIANPFDYGDYVKRKIKQKISEQNQRGIQTKKKLPAVNRDLYEKLAQEPVEKKGSKLEPMAILSDNRFASIFDNADFEIDKEDPQYQLMNPALSRMDKRKRKEREGEIKEEEDELRQRYMQKYADPASSSEDDLKDVISSSDEDEPKRFVVKKNKENLKKNKKAEQNWSRKESGGEATGMHEKEEGKSKEFAGRKEPTFRAVDRLSDVGASRQKMSKLSLKDRLAQSAEDGLESEVHRNAVGNAEMTFTTKKANKLARVREEQRTHHKERRTVRRSTHNLKGKFRPKDTLG